MFLFRGKETHPRSLVKAISWRFMGSLDTAVWSFIFTRSWKAAGGIAAAEFFTKIFLYYFHERIWATIAWGRKDGQRAD